MDRDQPWGYMVSQIHNKPRQVFIENNGGHCTRKILVDTWKIWGKIESLDVIAATVTPFGRKGTTQRLSHSKGAEGK